MAADDVVDDDDDDDDDELSFVEDLGSSFDDATLVVERFVGSFAGCL